MRYRTNVRLLALVAAFTLAATTGRAGAEVLSIGSSTFRVAWSSWSFAGGFGTVRCPVTLEGSFDPSVFEKVAGGPIGAVARAASGACASGGMTVLSETLPWEVQYSSFAGMLPNITELTTSVIGAAFIIREPSFGITCLARSTSANPMRLGATRESGGALTTVAAGGTIPTSCGVNGTPSGSGNVTQAGSSTRITLTLTEALGLGDLEIAPAEPIGVPGAGVEVSLRLRNRVGRVTITEIAISNGGAIFEIRDPAPCKRRTLSTFGLRECKFRIFSRAQNRNGEVTIEYTRPEAETRVLRLTS